MKPKTLYLVLCFAGVLVPYSQFVPWLLRHGRHGLGGGAARVYTHREHAPGHSTPLAGDRCGTDGWSLARLAVVSLSARVGTGTETGRRLRAILALSCSGARACRRGIV